MGKMIDLTFVYRNGMTFGNPENHPILEFVRMAKFEEKGFNTSSMLLGSHLGTHMDAPRHLIKDGETIEDIDISLCVGEVGIVDFRHISMGQRVELEDVINLEIKKRMIFVFGWSKYFGTPQFTDSWPYFSLAAAEYLVSKGLELIAVDIMSPDCKASGAENDYEVHKLFMNEGVLIVENLANTEKIEFDKDYILAALPLKLEGLDGSPCRVVLQEKDV